MPVMSLQPALFEGEQVPQIFPDDSARAGTFHPVTSHLAADSITAEGLRDSRMHVLLDLQAHGRCGAWELEARAGRWSGSRLRTALTELEGLGQVQRFEGTGLTARGRKCNEFALTILGLEALEAAR